MTRSSIRVAFLAVLIVAAAPAFPAQAQSSKPAKTKSPKVKLEKFKGQVLVFNTTQIVVQSTENTYFVRTFKFSPKLAPRMEKLAESGGYQSGDIVEVEYEAGSDVAVKIKGKPSKPL
jgi:hypothetical protein